MAAARVVTAIVAGANGRVAMLASGLALAVFPPGGVCGPHADSRSDLVLFCLLGTVVMFSGGELASPRRILLAGAFLGFAGAVKAWAIFTVIAALVICLPLWTAAVRPFVVGVLVGFGVPSLPSFLLAPPAFVHGIVFAQLHRKTPDKGSTPSATGSSRCSG